MVSSKDMEALKERVSRLEATGKHLATKADVAEARAEIANVRADMANTKSEIIKWVVGVGIAFGIGVATLNSSAILIALRLAG